MISLTVVSASIYSMINSLTPYFVAVFSICMLNADLYVHNYIAFLLVVIGSVLIALAGVLRFSGGNGIAPVSDVGAYIGMLIMLFISLFFAALQLVTEEILYQTWFLAPAMAVGTQGAWGLIIYTIVLAVCCNVACPKYGDLCNYDPNKQQFYLDSVQTYVQ